MWITWHRPRPAYYLPLYLHPLAVILTGRKWFYFCFSPRRGEPLHRLESNLAGRYANINDWGPKRTVKFDSNRPIFGDFQSTGAKIWWDSVHKSRVYNRKTARLSFLPTFGGDRFMPGDTRPKKEGFLGFFVCHAGRGLFWSRRPAAMFGTLTKYSFAIYRSIFTGFGAFLAEETYLHTSFWTKLVGRWRLKSAKILKVFQNLAEEFVNTTSTICNL